MQAIAVSQLNNYIKRVFEAEEMLHNIEVIGEIDGIGSMGANGIRFSLKDKDAVISCSSFNAGLIAKMREIKNGAQVIVRGTVTYWNKVGKINFNVYSCETYGIGQLFQKFEELKRKLESEGLFAAKQQMPAEVKRIGVVTSRTGAVIHDIIKVAHGRNPNIDIVLFPVAVQGEGADKQICEGINYFAGLKASLETSLRGAKQACPERTRREAIPIRTHTLVSPVDVIIVARGGGSSEDLAAFNSESIARAVFASTIPVVSAVGHETDWTLIDLVADVRAATPSNAAEIVVREVITEREAVIRAYRHLRSILKSKIEKAFGQIESAWVAAKNSINFKISDRESKVNALAGVIEAHNPLAVLRRGYAKVYKGSELVADVEGAEVGDKLDIKLYNGTIETQVTAARKTK